MEVLQLLDVFKKVQGQFPTLPLKRLNLFLTVCHKGGVTGYAKLSEILGYEYTTTISDVKALQKLGLSSREPLLKVIDVDSRTKLIQPTTYGLSIYKDFLKIQ